MKEENKSIHDFDFQLICDYFSSLNRQGPGSVEITKKALSFIHNLPPNAQIADLGCGTGTQTITLAESVQGQITALDLFPTFIDILKERITKEELQNQIIPVVGDMTKLPFEREELDLIWSEGAIYNIGFEYGLKLWKQYLKQGGYIAVSEVSWFSNDRPAEIEEFWLDAYPEIDTISNKIKLIEKAAYKPVAHFILPEDCWIDNFYKPMAPVREAFLKKHSDNKAAKEFIDNQQHEESLYYKYKEYYGYVFYIAQKL